MSATYFNHASTGDLMVTKLTDDELSSELARLQDWEVRDGKLHKEFKFSSFNEAFGFMARASMEIEKMNHHPEWCNVYNRLSVDLVTHDAGGITENDVRLAGMLDTLR
ncbi:pterin-4a-carbinolamine dehydratase [Cenarchaeum symbiosum A]|uniref:Putative pterin-4-alpha-carbinolamine dehydratase n=1 Tax=Cenarchaeum symbiosum (strain A) TaxID=414004 RepID=A0RWH7_CENSY|nr:pterin-4a-carbinolamine dehydratase [Cenarchaeum symbiosum A]